MSFIGSTTSYPLGTPASTDRVPYIDAAGGVLKQALVSSLAGFIYASNVWIETASNGGDDATGEAGNPNKPFATIDAALDATTGATVLHLGIGAFPPVTDDRSGSSVNPSSKLRSDLWFKGSKQPTLDDWTTPTTLINGTIIKGRLNFHSTRHNIVLTDGGSDSGSAVCTALFSGVAQEGLLFNNIPQTVSLAPSRRPQVHKWSVLCKDASSAVHAFLLENTVDFSYSGCESYYGTHGFAMKSAYGSLDGLISKGHGTDVIVFKDGGAATNVAPCHDLTVSNVVGGAFNAGDTPDGLVFDAGGTSGQMKRLAITNVALVGVSANDVKLTNTAAVAAPCMSDIRIDNFVTDNGTIRVTTTANADLASIFINEEPLTGVVALTDASTINTDADSRRGNGAFAVTLGASGRTLANPTNLAIGKTYIWLITTGSGTITTYGSLFAFLPSATPTTSAGAGVDVLTAVYDGTKLRSVYSKP